MALQAALPKVSAMPHPAGEIDAWVEFAVEKK